MHQRDGRTDGHRATAKTALTHSIVRVKSETPVCPETPVHVNNIFVYTEAHLFCYTTDCVSFSQKTGLSTEPESTLNIEAAIDVRLSLVIHAHDNGYGTGLSGRTENARTENVSNGVWITQIRKMEVEKSIKYAFMCVHGKRKT